MSQIPELGDIVCIRKNKSIWMDENGLYIITKLNNQMLPVEVKALSKSKSHFVGESIKHKNLINFIKPLKITASEMINKDSFLWLKDSNELQPSTIVHFIGNNRELEFVIIDDKLVSNIEFEFYTFKKGISKGRIAIELPSMVKSNLTKVAYNSICNVIQELKFLF